MESTVRWILLFIGTLVILGIWWDGLRRNKQSVSITQKEMDEQKKDDEEQSILDQLVKPDEESLIQIREEDPLLSEEILKDLATPKQERKMCMELETKPGIVSIYIMAKGNESFEGYNLLQTILSYNMQYGEMQIFHRYTSSKTNKKILFSLVSATEPGDFDLQEMGSFSCKGLILFMDIVKVTHPLKVFNTMLETATHLAEDLGGELKLDHDHPLTQEWIEEMRRKVIARGSKIRK